MKQLLSILLFLIPFVGYSQATVPGFVGTMQPPPAAAATFTALSHGTAFGLDHATTGNINTSGATLIVIGVTDYAGNVRQAPTDNQGNTYTLAKTYDDCTGNDRSSIYYKFSPATSATHTFTATTTVANNFAGDIFVQTFTGGGTAFDQSNAAGATCPCCVNVTTQQPGSITPTSANQLVVTVLADYVCSSDPTINSGFTISDIQHGAGGTNYAGAMAYIIQTSAAAVNPTWTMCSNPTNAATIISIKP